MTLPRPGFMPWFWLTSPVVTLIRWLLLIEPLRRLWGLLWIRNRETASAEIKDLGFQNRFAAFYLSSFATFDVRGRAVRLDLTRWQALRFARHHFEEETGRLTFQGKRLLRWEPSDSLRGESMTDAPEIRVFLSHSHVQKKDARWVADVLSAHGCEVWLDENELEPSDHLSKEIRRGIEGAVVMVPLLSKDYMVSDWCLEEVDLAASAGVDVRPIQVSQAELTLPPRWRTVLSEKLGDPVHLDLKGRGAQRKLREFAEKIAADHAGDGG